MLKKLAVLSFLFLTVVSAAQAVDLICTGGGCGGTDIFTLDPRSTPTVSAIAFIDGTTQTTKATGGGGSGVFNGNGFSGGISTGPSLNMNGNAIVNSSGIALNGGLAPSINSTMTVLTVNLLNGLPGMTTYQFGLSTFTAPSIVTTTLTFNSPGEPVINTSTQVALRFVVSGSTYSMFTSSLTIPGALVISSVSVQPTANSGAAIFYSSNTGTTMEAFVVDGASNRTQISPHNAAGNWAYQSTNDRTGKSVYIDMERFIARMEQALGERFMFKNMEEALAYTAPLKSMQGIGTVTITPCAR